MLQTYGIIALIVIASCAGSYGMGRKHANENCKTQNIVSSHNAIVSSINRLTELGKDFAKAGGDLAAAVRGSKANTKVVIKTVKERIDAKPSDPVCVVPPDDVRMWNEQVSRVQRAVDRGVSVRDPG